MKQRFELNITWTMLVPTNFKRIILANDIQDALTMANIEAKRFSFEDWEKSNTSTENIYFEDYNEIKITKIN